MSAAGKYSTSSAGALRAAASRSRCLWARVTVHVYPPLLLRRVGVASCRQKSREGRGSRPSGARGGLVVVDECGSGCWIGAVVLPSLTEHGCQQRFSAEDERC